MSTLSDLYSMRIITSTYTFRNLHCEVILKFKDLMGLHSDQAGNIYIDEISCATVFPSFQKWVNTCYIKSCGVSIDSDWKLIRHTKQTVMYWEHNRTWKRAPLFLELDYRLHLIEGHSRFGCLKGLVSKGLIPKNKTHKVWLAKNV